MLHTLSHSPYQVDFAALLRNVREEDALLLLQDGVIAALADTDYCRQLLALGAELCVLQPDLAARGVEQRISSQITPIDYQQFVQLTERHTQQVAW